MMRHTKPHNSSWEPIRLQSVARKVLCNAGIYTKIFFLSRNKLMLRSHSIAAFYIVYSPFQFPDLRPPRYAGYP